MFLENSNKGSKMKGWIEVIAGSMFSGKTAEYVTKVHAICMQCGNLAHYSFRKDTSDKIVLIGEKKVYEPLCRRCYYDIQSRGKTPGSK